MWGYLLIFLFAAQSFVLKTQAQCTVEGQIAVCTANAHVPMHFLKSYRVEPSRADQGYIEYSYVLTKNTTYALSLCTPAAGADGIVITLFDSQRNIVATNKTPQGLFPSINFNCMATGIFYMRYTFENSVHRSGLSVLMFSMNEKIAP